VIIGTADKVTYEYEITWNFHDIECFVDPAWKWEKRSASIEP